MDLAPVDPRSDNAKSEHTSVYLYAQVADQHTRRHAVASNAVQQKHKLNISSSKTVPDAPARQRHGIVVHTENWKHTCVRGAHCMQAVTVHIQQPVGLIKNSAGS